MNSKRPKVPPSRVPQKDKEFPPLVGANTGSNAPGRESKGIKYGPYIADLIDASEFPVFDDFWAKLNSEFTLNDSSDRISAELACVYYVRLQRAIKAGNDESIKNMDFLMRMQLNMLKVTRISREGQTVTVATNTTPAEWATSLLEKAKGDGRKGKDSTHKATRAPGRGSQEPIHPASQGSGHEPEPD